MPTPLSWPLVVTPPSPPVPEVPVAYGDQQYAAQFFQLLPPGRLWNPEIDESIRKILLGIAGEFARVDARGSDLIDESDPRTADETIGDWERLVNLPDDRVLAIPPTLAERRIAVTQKFVAREGQNVEFFVRICAACGYTLQPYGVTAPPVITSTLWLSNVGGSLASGVYFYRVAARNFYGTTLPSIDASVTVLAGTSTNRAQVTWGKVYGATSYDIFGRTHHGELYMGTVAAGTLTFIDDGSIIPSAAMPTDPTAIDEPITKFAARLLRANFRCNDRCWDINWAYAMQLNILPPSGTVLALADFERVIRHVTHSHIVDVFNFL